MNILGQKNQKIALFILIMSQFFSYFLFANDLDAVLFLSNKVIGSNTDWRFSGEYQVRLNDNISSLKEHYFEGVASYLPNERWEIVPDFRVTVKPERLEFRPGIGLIHKTVWGKKIFLHQLVNQVKWQTDIESTGIVKHGLRYALFYNYVFDKKWMFISGGGILYRFSDAYDGFQYVRFFAGLGYQIASDLFLNVNYYLGLEDPFGAITYETGPMINLVIRLKNNTKYLPARYIN